MTHPYQILHLPGVEVEVLGHSDEAVERVRPVGEPNQVQAHRRLVLLQLDQLENIALDWGLGKNRNQV